MNIPLQNVRIFCVESDARTRHTLQVVLSHMGALVATDRWGFAETAIPKLTGFSPDLILLEWRAKPYRRVCEVYAALRLVPALANVPVAVLSAQPLPITPDAMHADGISGVIKTPLDAHTLTAEVPSLLRLATARAAASRLA
jgi:CheY-like chemotaxis protein